MVPSGQDNDNTLKTEAATLWSSTNKDGNNQIYFLRVNYDNAMPNNDKENEDKQRGYGVRCVFNDTIALPSPAINFECGTSTVSDYNNNTYNTIAMGSQCWMKENLRATNYANGAPITPAPTNDTTSNTTGWYYHVSGNSSNDATKGLLYNWPAVMNGSASSNSEPSGVQGPCPDGWHVPSYAEFNSLITYVNSIDSFQCDLTDQYVAKALASQAYFTSTSNACAPGNDLSENNKTGFSMIPCGFEGSQGSNRVGKDATLWSSTLNGDGKPFFLRVDYAQPDVNHSENRHEKKHGFSVRCVLNDTISTEPENVCGTSTVSDYDNNVYNTVQIDGQCWLKENLRTTHYSDGTAIPLGSGYSETASYLHVAGDGSNDATYGLLYNYKAVMNGAASINAVPSGVQGICPTGWHVPSRAEYENLLYYLSNHDEYHCEGNSSDIAKSLASTTTWNSSSTTCAIGNDPSANNATGFSAVAAGGWFGNYFNKGIYAELQTTTTVDTSVELFRLYKDSPNCIIFGYRDIGDYFPVRCLKDE